MIRSSKCGAPLLATAVAIWLQVCVCHAGQNETMLKELMFVRNPFANPMQIDPALSTAYQKQVASYRADPGWVWKAEDVQRLKFEFYFTNAVAEDVFLNKIIPEIRKINGEAEKVPLTNVTPQKFVKLQKFEYRLGPMIGSGSFGFIHLCENINTNEIVVLKFEKVDPRPKMPSNLLNEVSIYKSIGCFGTVDDTIHCPNGIPTAEDSGNYSEPLSGSFHVLAMKRLGESVDKLWKTCDEILTKGTVYSTLAQIVAILKSLHGKGILHRDLKPQNMVMGVGLEANKVYLLDFGLSIKIKNQFPGTIEINEQLGEVGSLAFMSSAANLGFEQSVEDEFESLAYVGLYLLKYPDFCSCLSLDLGGLSQQQRSIKFYDFKQKLDLKNLQANYPVLAEMIRYGRKQALLVGQGNDPHGFWSAKLSGDLSEMQHNALLDWKMKHDMSLDSDVTSMQVEYKVTKVEIKTTTPSTIHYFYTAHLYLSRYYHFLFETMNLGRGIQFQMQPDLMELAAKRAESDVPVDGVDEKLAVIKEVSNIAELVAIFQSDKNYTNFVNDSAFWQVGFGCVHRNHSYYVCALFRKLNTSWY